jgi:hypothetical protein
MFNDNFKVYKSLKDLVKALVYVKENVGYHHLI